jgi:hypothetical protein
MWVSKDLRVWIGHRVEFQMLGIFVWLRKLVTAGKRDVESIRYLLPDSGWDEKSLLDLYPPKENGPKASLRPAIIRWTERAREDTIKAHKNSSLKRRNER